MLAADALIASGQMMRRPALASSASVTLIVRVESLSVVANAETAGGPAAAGAPAALHPISITTSWAVPANFTTFRLSEYFGHPETIPAATEDSGSGAMKVQARLAADGASELVVESGDTNQARTRTDELDAGVYPDRTEAPGADEEGGMLNILVQAL